MNSYTLYILHVCSAPVGIFKHDGIFYIMAQQPLFVMRLLLLLFYTIINPFVV